MYNAIHNTMMFHKTSYHDLPLGNIVVVHIMSESLTLLMSVA